MIKIRGAAKMKKHEDAEGTIRNRRRKIILWLIFTERKEESWAENEVEKTLKGKTKREKKDVKM